MARLRRKPDDRVGIPLAPMIDCVFLLLIFFMVSTTLEEQEADLSFELPGTVETMAPLDIPDEQVIEIRDDGQAVVNDYAYDRPASTHYTELAVMLGRYQAACTSTHSEARVTLAPADGTPHQAVVKVMDACARAGVHDVQFAQ
ncbi:biopolymer transporter ExbD [Ruficoccus sp. ZRK36]|uniref:ExbD/TolR family protein n=1 Tax=Ruficoccus sp. ZRK36 TaxID=2866311 RepID=UPI001C733204|nr:biopolymer transporter ExbD [Ruficoccus sp. ZRK36]QYY34444.1 biopolymer transporter ExbD [Ruficoccus sp. ZRK36]